MLKSMPTFPGKCVYVNAHLCVVTEQQQLVVVITTRTTTTATRTTTTCCCNSPTQRRVRPTDWITKINKLIINTIFGLSFCRFSFSLWSSFSSRGVRPTKVCSLTPGRGSQDLFFHFSSSKNAIENQLKK